MLLGGMAAISALVCLGTVMANGLGLHLLWQIPVSFLGSFLGLVILAALLLLVLAFSVDRNTPQKHDSFLYRKAIDLFV